MAVDVLPEACCTGCTTKKCELPKEDPPKLQLKNRYGTYGLGPHDQRKYYLRCTSSGNDQPFGTNRTRVVRKSNSAQDKPEKHWVIIPDLIRSYTIPSKRDPSGKSIILQQSDVERIKTAARRFTPDEKHAMFESILQERQNEMTASRGRRETLQLLDKERGRQPKLPTESEMEGKQRTDALLKRVNDYRLEKEPEMIQLNQHIIAIKDAAIHKKQMENRERLNKTLEAEEERLETMMEEERLESVEREKQRENQAKTLSKKYAKVLQCQMKDNENARALERRKHLEERKHVLQAMTNTIDDFDEQFRVKKQKQRMLKEALDECVQGLMHRILEDKWQDKLRDQEAEIYNRQKNETQKQEDDEKKKKMEMRQEILDQNYTFYEKMMAGSTDWHDMRIRRDVEEEERKWRQNQKDMRLDKLKKLEQFKRGRNADLELNRKITAVYLQEEKEGYQTMIKAQKESIVKERELDRKNKQKRYALAQAQLEQIKENERRRIRDRAQQFADGAQVLNEKEKIMQELEDMKSRKLREVREKCPDVPNKYIEFVERKVRISPTLKMKFDQKFTKLDR